MPRKAATTVIDKEPEFVEIVSPNEDIPPGHSEPAIELVKEKKPRVKIPRQVIRLVVDAGRSRIKCQAFSDISTTDVVILDSLVCRVDGLPSGERGAFSTSRAKDESGKKDVVEHWIVGSSARFQGKEFIAMSDGENHKIEYFPILVLGAIASLPNLYEMSTGTTERNRTLTIEISSLSLAPSNVLGESIKKCRWVIVDGIKYRLSFSRSGLSGFPEGYGAAMYSQLQIGNSYPVFYTFDIGFGTATLTEYSNLGKLPKRGMCSPNGGGGIATLIREFSEQISNSDSAKIIRPSQLREILETADYKDDKVIASDSDGRDIGNALELAIKSWIRDSPLTYAIEKIGVSGRRYPVTLCGGGFAIPPVRELVRNELLKSGIPVENLILPENPGTVALAAMKRLYIQDVQEESQSENTREAAD